MIFKSLVEALLKQDQHQDDAYALNHIKALTRELKNDLIDAYRISAPLVQKHSQTFWSSHSFFDFLLTLLHIPIKPDSSPHLSEVVVPPDDFQRKERVQFPDWELCQEQLNACLQEKTRLHTDLKSVNTQLQTHFQENERLHIDLESCKTQLDSCKGLFKHCERMRKEDEERLNYRYTNCLEEKLKFETDLKLLRKFFQSLYPTQLNQFMKTFPLESVNRLGLLESEDASYHVESPPDDMEEEPHEGSPSEKPILVTPLQLDAPQKCTRCDTEDTRFIKCQSDLERMEVQFNQCQLDHQRVETQCRTYQVEKRNIQKQLDTCQSEIQQMKEQLETCELDKQQMKEQLDTYQSDYPILKKEVETYQLDNRTLKEQLDECESANRTLEKNLTQIKKRMKTHSLNKSPSKSPKKSAGQSGTLETRVKTPSLNPQNSEEINRKIEELYNYAYTLSQTIYVLPPNLADRAYFNAEPHEDESDKLHAIEKLIQNQHKTIQDVHKTLEEKTSLIQNSQLEKQQMKEQLDLCQSDYRILKEQLNTRQSDMLEENLSPINKRTKSQSSNTLDSPSKKQKKRKGTSQKIEELYNYALLHNTTNAFPQNLADSAHFDPHEDERDKLYAIEKVIHVQQNTIQELHSKLDEKTKLIQNIRDERNNENISPLEALKKAEASQDCEQIKKYQQEIEKLKEDNAKKHTEYESLFAESEENIKDYNAQIKYLKEKLSKNKHYLDEQMIKENAFSTEIQRYTVDIEEKDTEIQQCRADIEEKRETIQTLQNQMTLYQQQINNQTQKIKKLEHHPSYEVMELIREQCNQLSKFTNLPDIEPYNFADVIIQKFQDSLEVYSKLKNIAALLSIPEDLQLIEARVHELMTHFNMVTQHMTSLFPEDSDKDIDSYLKWIIELLRELERYFTISIQPAMMEKIIHHIHDQFTRTSLSFKGTNDPSTFNDTFTEFHTQFKHDVENDLRSKRTITELVHEPKEKMDIASPMEPGVEIRTPFKRLAVGPNWNIFEMQTIFLAFYKLHFQLLLKYKLRIFPTEISIRDSILTKLDILKNLQKTQREGALFSIYETYVKYDLRSVIENENTLLMQMNSLNGTLNQCMAETKQYLETLINKYCKKDRASFMRNQKPKIPERIYRKKNLRESLQIPKDPKM